MSVNIKAYVDDNETIYVSDWSVLILNPGIKGSMFTGLDQIDELPGQSTVFVNKIRFHACGWIDPDGSDLNNTTAYMLAGVVPEGEFSSSNAPGELDDYQTIKGFPLKNCFGYASTLKPRDAQVTEENWQQVNNYFSWTRTYSPRKALLLSRLQEICFTVFNADSTGSDLRAWVNVEMQLKRGD